MRCIMYTINNNINNIFKYLIPRMLNGFLFLYNFIFYCVLSTSDMDNIHYLFVSRYSRVITVD